MRVLVIDKHAKNMIAEVIAYAMDHVFSREELKAMMSGNGPVPGDASGAVCTVYDGFRVAFSFETQPAGVCRHMSISIPTKGKYPNPASVEVLMTEFGFTGGLKEASAVWKEEDFEAINVLQLANP